jgi:hypothetical protein
MTAVVWRAVEQKFVNEIMFENHGRSHGWGNQPADISFNLPISV